MPGTKHGNCGLGEHRDGFFLINSGIGLTQVKDGEDIRGGRWPWGPGQLLPASLFLNLS